MLLSYPTIFASLGFILGGSLLVNIERIFKTHAVSFGLRENYLDLDYIYIYIYVYIYIYECHIGYREG